MLRTASSIPRAFSLVWNAGQEEPRATNPGRRGSVALPLPPWISTFQEWPESDSEEEEQEESNSLSYNAVARDAASRTKASRMARPRVPLFAWERSAPSQQHLMDEESRRKRIEKAFKSARRKTVIMRAWIILLFIFFNVYSLYMAAGDIHNSVVVFHPNLATMKNENGSPKQLVAGAFTYAGSERGSLFAECFLVMFIALLTKLTIWITMMPFMIICMHWKAEPKLHLEDLMPDSKDWPTVDIFLPRYKEAWESFEPTIRATLASPEVEATPKDSDKTGGPTLPVPRTRTSARHAQFSFTASRAAPHSMFSGTFALPGSLPSPAARTRRRSSLLSRMVPFSLAQSPRLPTRSPFEAAYLQSSPRRRPPNPVGAPRYSFMYDPSQLESGTANAINDPTGAGPKSQGFQGFETEGAANSSPKASQGALNGTEPGSPMKAAAKPPPLRIEEDSTAMGPAPSQELPPMPDYPALEYPPSKLNIYICDDGSRDPKTSIESHVSKLVASLPPGMPKVHYITRENGHHAKAGNLNNALKHANGDLVVVLDSDHIASPGFLLDLVPHMLCQKKQTGDVEKGKPDASSWTLEGSRVGMIQSKQYFYNENEFVPYICGADNKIYYYLFQHGLDGLGAANCVGTGYVMNRKALDEIGGYVGGWAVEDSFTSTTMLKAGWQTKYTPDCEAIGLSPPTLSEHVQQRWRWSVGSAQLMLYGDYTSKLPFLQAVGIVSGNWYPISLSLVFLIIILRLACFVAYVFIAGPTGTTATQVATSWLALFILLVMPQVGLLGKAFDVIGMYILQSVNLTVMFYALIGRLDPAKKKVPKIKAASEAQGDLKLPPMVIIMTVVVVVIIIASLLVQLIAPDNSNVELGIALSVSILFMLVLVAAPVAIIYVVGALKELKRGIRRKLRPRAKKTESPYPPVYFKGHKKPEPKRHGSTEPDLMSVGK